MLAMLAETGRVSLRTARPAALLGLLMPGAQGRIRHGDEDQGQQEHGQAHFE
jgi:hypothetical protein